MWVDQWGCVFQDIFGRGGPFFLLDQCGLICFGVFFRLFYIMRVWWSILTSRSVWVDLFWCIFQAILHHEGVVVHSYF